MKIIAAIMDVAILKFWRYEDKVWLDSRTKKKYLVYDPRKVTCREIDDARAKQIR